MNALSSELLLGLLVGLLFLSAFFSSSETGMLALDRYRLRSLSKKGHRSAQRVHRLLERKDRLLGLILIGNNVVNISASVLTTVLALRLYGDAGPLIATITLTFFILVFAETGPKTLAALHPERIAFGASYILAPLMVLLMPLVKFLNFFSNAMLRVMGVKPDLHRDQPIDHEDLLHILHDQEADLPDKYRQMLVNILRLEHITVDDIMAPRNQVVGAEINSNPQQLLELFAEDRITRVPVYQGDLDHIIGVLDVRDLPRLLQNPLTPEALRKFAQKPYFVPEGTTVPTQLHNFQEENSSLAIVVDEYGATEGIVTMQDILEEIVGKVNLGLRETAFSQDIHPRPDGSYIIEGATTIHDINKELGWSLPSNGVTTLNGLIVKHLGSLPEPQMSIKVERYILEVLSVRDDKVVRRARLRLAAEDDTAEEKETPDTPVVQVAEIS